MSTVSVGGVVDAATERTMHVRLNARATAEHRPRRDSRATLTARGVDTREPQPERPNAANPTPQSTEAPRRCRLDL